MEDQYYKNLYCNKAVTPKFYATIKTHKEGNPIRPIVSFIESPTYRLAQHLSKILMPITDQSCHKLRNSYTMRDELEAMVIPE